jgi:hypothetical protein
MHKQISPARRKSIEGHLKGDQDYFGTLAAVLDLLRPGYGAGEETCAQGVFGAFTG